MKSMVNVLKFEYFYLSVLKLIVVYQGWNSQNDCQKQNRGDPDQTASSEAVRSRSALFG